MMHSITRCIIKAVVSFFIVFNTSILWAFDFDAEDVFYSTYVSYGDKWASYTFLEDSVRIPTVNFTAQATLGEHSLGVNLEKTINSPSFEQVGVIGRVERSDFSVNISTRLYENFTPSYIDTPYVINYFYGYADGETRVNFDDGVWINYSENGVFAGISAAWFYNKWLASLSASLSRGYWYGTSYQQRSSDGGVKVLDGISSGWSLSVNYSVPIKKLPFDNDVFVGFKSNNYSVVINKLGGGLPYIRERLVFYYLGLSVYY